MSSVPQTSLNVTSHFTLLHWDITSQTLKLWRKQMSGVLSWQQEGLRHLSQPKATPYQTAKPEFRNGPWLWPKSSHSQQGPTQQE